MNSAYSNYLNSPGWQIKRIKRLELSRFKCEACAATVGLEIHHLTYERIFNEDIDDLMALCRTHHRLAESLVKSGEVARSGDIVEIRNKTLFHMRYAAQELERPMPVARIKNVIRPPAEKIHGMRKKLMADPCFVPMLSAKTRGDFKKLVRAQFRDCTNFQVIMANALILFKNRKHLWREKYWLKTA